MLDRHLHLVGGVFTSGSNMADLQNPLPLPLELTIPTNKGVFCRVTQLSDGRNKAFSEFDVQLDCTNSLKIIIYFC